MKRNLDLNSPFAHLHNFPYPLTSTSSLASTTTFFDPTTTTTTATTGGGGGGVLEGSANKGPRRKEYAAPAGVWKNSGGFISTVYIQKKRVYGPLRRSVEAAVEDRAKMLEAREVLHSEEQMRQFVQTLKDDSASSAHYRAYHQHQHHQQGMTYPMARTTRTSSLALSDPSADYDAALFHDLGLAFYDNNNNSLSQPNENIIINNNINNNNHNINNHNNNNNNNNEQLALVAPNQDDIWQQQPHIDEQLASMFPQNFEAFASQAKKHRHGCVVKPELSLDDFIRKHQAKNNNNHIVNNNNIDNNNNNNNMGYQLDARGSPIYTPTQPDPFLKEAFSLDTTSTMGITTLSPKKEDDFAATAALFPLYEDHEADDFLDNIININCNNNNNNNNNNNSNNNNDNNNKNNKTNNNTYGSSKDAPIGNQTDKGVGALLEDKEQVGMGESEWGN